jgi:hypothetical protein
MIDPEDLILGQRAEDLDVQLARRVQAVAKRLFDHPSAPKPLMIALAAVVIAPIIFSVIGLSSFFSLAMLVLRWPSLLVPAGGDRLGRDQSLWAEPHRGALAMAFGRERGRSHRVARRLGSLLLVHRPLRRIQPARSRHRHDDVDVDLRHRHLSWRRAKRRDQTSNRERLN